MRTRALTVLLPILLAVSVFLPAVVSAGACHLTATQIDFGTFDPLTRTGVQAVGTITYRCSTSTTNIRITLSTGRSNDLSRRALGTPGTRVSLPYLLTLDPTRTQVWGNGYGLTVVYSVPAAPANTPIQIPVYAYLPPGVPPPVGPYTDTITVELSYN